MGIPSYKRKHKKTNGWIIYLLYGEMVKCEVVGILNLTLLQKLQKKMSVGDGVTEVIFFNE